LLRLSASPDVHLRAAERLLQLLRASEPGGGGGAAGPEAGTAGATGAAAALMLRGAECGDDGRRLAAGGRLVAALQPHARDPAAEQLLAALAAAHQWLAGRPLSPSPPPSPSPSPSSMGDDGHGAMEFEGYD